MKEINFNFLKRHLGPNDKDIELMLKSMSINTIDDLIKKVIPPNIFSKIGEDLIEINLSEDEVLLKLKDYLEHYQFPFLLVMAKICIL